MINIGKILKQSWHILWNYRILWVFGVLLALTTGGTSSGNRGSSSQPASTTGNGFQGGIPANSPEWVRQLFQWFTQDVEPLFTHPAQHIGTFVLIFAVIFLVILLISVLAALVRYPSETAVMRMVDEYEQSGTKLGFRQGWKLGWTRRAFRLWLIDLLLSIPPFVLVLVLLASGLAVYFSLTSTIAGFKALGVIAAISIAFLSLLILVVLAIVLTFLRNFFARAAALEGLGTIASIKQGWAVFKGNWKSAGLMWLVMVGIGIAIGIAGIIVFFVLIPAYLVLLLPAALVAALPALLTLGIASLFAPGPLAWILAVLAAIPFFFITLFAPLIFLNGWVKIYTSSVWTLTYREIKALESLAPPAVSPAPVAPAEPPAPVAPEGA